MRWVAVLKEILRDVVVPVTVAGLAAYAAIRAAQADSMGGLDGKIDDPGTNGPHCCCGCSCARCRASSNVASTPNIKLDEQNHQLGTLGE